MKFISPLKVFASRAKSFVLNLNQYRNTHFRVLNNCKINYKEILAPQILMSKRYDKAICVYKVYQGSKRHYDLGNVCCVHEKFFEDAFVEFKKLEDDNVDYIPIVVYLKGETDTDKPRVEIEVLDFNKEGLDKLFDMIYNVYIENGGEE